MSNTDSSALPPKSPLRVRKSSGHASQSSLSMSKIPSAISAQKISWTRWTLRILLRIILYRPVMLLSAFGLLYLFGIVTMWTFAWIALGCIFGVWASLGFWSSPKKTLQLSNESEMIPSQTDVDIVTDIVRKKPFLGVKADDAFVVVHRRRNLYPEEPSLCDHRSYLSPKVSSSVKQLFDCIIRDYVCSW